ncbi:rhodanese-like domain-containing protein [Marivita sp. S6314]|uniref:rhodanese-like domain-containing protein n=1 Tax=Marivita sp. S6314 TaxID=2926406 RepID=UPI001FF24971|nr:rhodanese-like domain-containing protein [Marivita sp. S6314]MCK0150293.1 rhodanese-like domain-containing protein [Marivita sp. S6314]
MVPVFRAVALTVALLGSPLAAQSAAITDTATTFSFTMNGTEMTVSRRGASCPTSCVQPMQIAPGVATLAELEVIAFLQDAVSDGTGLLVDVRMPGTFSSGSLPGAVNVPVATFQPSNPYRNDLLSALGVTNLGASPGFSNAFSLVIFAGGADDQNAADAIKSLLDAGYPASKIRYYRGGASSWTTLGLNLSVGQ